MEMMELLEQGYHMAYCDDYGDYFTAVLTNDNGQMGEKDIKYRFFDFEYVDVEEEC